MEPQGGTKLMIKGCFKKQPIHIAVAGIFVSVCLMLFYSPPAMAANTCSDVSAPLPSWITTAVNNNLSFYQTVSAQTGVPWEMLASIHYRETNFSHTNPSNGQGIFQFANGAGGPYPPGPVSDTEFTRQLTYMAQQIQSDYVYRGTLAYTHRALQQNEPDDFRVQDTLFSYNGRASVYAQQASMYGFDPTTQPYEGSPYVMNMFDCFRPSMGMITTDYGSLNGLDARYGTFTLYTRLKSDVYWQSRKDWLGFSVTPLIRSYNSGSFYIRGAQGNLYTIVLPSALSDLGYGGSLLNSFMSASDSYIQLYDTSSTLAPLIRFDDSPNVYFYAQGILHYVNYATYQAYGSLPVSVLPAYERSFLSTGPDATTLVRDLRNGNMYSISGGKKHYIVGPSALTYYNINGSGYVDGGAELLDSLPDGIPLATPGTIIKASDNSAVGIVDPSAGTSIYPISPSAVASIQTTQYVTSPAIFQQFTVDSGAPLNLLAKDSANNLYLLDGTAKYNLSQAQLTTMGKAVSDFILADPTFLDRFTTASISGSTMLTRAAGSNTVYAIVNGELLTIQTLGIFNQAGFSMSSVVNLQQNTLTSTLTNNNKYFVPQNSLFRVGSSASVYLLDNQGTAHLIPTGDIFNDFGFSYNSVQTINTVTFNSLTQGSALQNTVSAPDGSIWAISYRARYWISPSLASTYATSQNIAPVSAGILAPMAIGQNMTKFIRIDQNATVYYVNNAQKTPLQTPQTFANYGGTSWNQVIGVSPTFANTLATQPLAQ